MNRHTQAALEETVIETRFAIAEAARRVGRHPLTLRRLEASGTIPLAKRDIHGRRVYTEADVQLISAILNRVIDPAQQAS